MQEPERDPARREMVFGAVVVARGFGRIARHLVGGLRVADVEQLAGEQAALDPPFVGIVALIELLWQRAQQRHRLGDVIAAPEHLQAGELVADVVAGRRRHGFEQGLVAVLAKHRDAGLGDGRLVAAEAFGGAQPCLGVVLLVEAAIHARLVVVAGQKFAEAVLDLLFDVRRKAVGAPGLAHQRLGGLAIALGQQRARQREATLG